MIGVAVFDAYGTVFDVHSAVRRHSGQLGERADVISQLWRQRQLEYSWVSSLAGRYRDFWTLTQEALDFALAAHGIEDATLRASLLDAYLSLEAYPEVPMMLTRLKEMGVRAAILSNGSPAMLERAVKSAALGDLLEAVISVDEVRIYKPDPEVYAYCCDRLGIRPGDAAFMSSNAWDAAGAGAFGFRVHWVNRTGQPREYPSFGPVLPLSDLSGLPALLA